MILLVKSSSLTIQMKASEQHFTVALSASHAVQVASNYQVWMKLYSFYHLHESYWAVLWRGTIYCAPQEGLTTWLAV